MRRAGLAINVVTGLTLFIAAAAEKGTQRIFYVKLSLIALALLTDVRMRRVLFGDEAVFGSPIPVEARGLAAASLLLWGGAITAGPDKLLALGPDDPMPVASRIVGALSLVSWFAVLVCGRMLAFVGGTD